MRKTKIIVATSLEATITNKEHFNPFQTGYGVHKSEKYPNRSKRKNTLRKEILSY